MTINLSEKAVLVRLRTSAWSAQKFDRRVSDEVSKTHKAEARAGRFYKDLIRDDQLKAINRVITDARQFHDYKTLPWLDNGTRILPSKAYLEYVEEMREYREAVDMLVDEFVNDYYDLAIDRAKQHLGDLYNPADYPTKDELRHKFGISMRLMPIPDASDWRIDVQQDELNELIEDHTRQLKEASEHATREIVNRIHETVSHVYERLSDEDKRFHNSLIGHVESLVEVLPQLNITDDQQIAKLTEEMRLKLATVDPTELRKDADARRETAQTAKSILDTMSSVYGTPAADDSVKDDGGDGRKAA